MLALLSGYFGDPTDPRLIPASVSLELVHVATLYHDDVIDEAESRHGVPAANVRWDNTVAILTGDYLFARASEVGADLGPDVCRILAQTIAVLCDGQIREVDAARRLDRTEASYLEVIRRKTGALIAASCRLGAMMSDAPAEHVDILEAFGESLGLAFQLSDDIMDLTASQLELGKEPGVDLKEGVYTLPVLHALEHSPAPRGAGPDPRHRRARRAPRPRARDRRGRGLDRARPAGRPRRGRARGRARRTTPVGARAACIGAARALPFGAVRGGRSSREGALMDHARIRAREDFHKRA